MYFNLNQTPLYGVILTDKRNKADRHKPITLVRSPSLKSVLYSAFLQKLRLHTFSENFL